MASLTTLHYIAFVVVIVGALNWGAVALTDKPDGLLGFLNTKDRSLDKTYRFNYARLVYGLVGISGLYLAGTALYGKIENDKKK